MSYRYPQAYPQRACEQIEPTAQTQGLACGRAAAPRLSPVSGRHQPRSRVSEQVIERVIERVS